MSNPDLLVLGGGPAGLCGAIEAAREGLRVLVVDEGISPGGQLVKQTHKFFGSENFYASTRGMEIAVKLLKELSLYSRATIASESSVLAIYPDGVPVLDRRSDSTTLYNPARLLVATGASERFLQFDNNDLPGVYGAGAVQTLMNQFGILPGKSVLMIGSGNIGLIVSYQLAQAGVEVKAILEASSRIGGYRVHADKVKRLGIPVLLNHTILKAIGEESVKGALITALDDRWKPVPGTERELVIDTICIAVGLTPSAELVAQAGGQLKYIPELGGYVPLHDGDMRTTIDRVFVAGDVSGIEEATTAMIEGRIAGLNIVKDIKGECDETRLTDLKETLNRFRCGPTSSKIRSGLEKMNLATRAARYVEGEVNRPEEFRGKLRPIIECFEAIPCNPCETSCPVGAIKIGANINDVPVIDYSRCTGCGVCATKCPGLAIFMYQEREDGMALVGIPYEFLPVPERGQTVYAIGRNGEVLCTARVDRITRSANKTNIVYLTVPEELGRDVRHIHVTNREESSLVCRCEEITVEQVKKAIREGYVDFEELRRYLRVSMGPCGGRTCRLNTLMILSGETGLPVEKLSPGTLRPPVIPVSFGAIERNVKVNEDEK
ncbi:MAG TPA: FAD-dependent oxidoreductase [Mesotoga infera]|uniref:Thioredoxin reductase n=1 Tax=Mesotoga infera TaxID=1236046 RepID=A0A7Z7LEV5_9BACT|nr:FAD-dependent oxidoreductase [Mesotoga infera]MBP8660470.1 FAD-dependent oxidoreductase [Mesotoga sp.]SSC12203.1 Thioredoxin reductase [Mesotoga infera]HOI34520.1 FAD-dependent oxidoreductase [Mesotoga infera]HON28243.1 FAD-dependent oxidoreductase [Mesotoga infera]HPD37825.1 FAD-dependent oxidoreductase [Mesotoga infera]